MKDPDRSGSVAIRVLRCIGGGIAYALETSINSTCTLPSICNVHAYPNYCMYMYI